VVKPIGYLFFRWRSVVALLGGILVAMGMLLLASGKPPGAQTPTGVTAVSVAAGGLHSLMLDSDGTVWTWGENSSGQLGDGTTTDRATPVQVKGPGGVEVLDDVTAISAGASFSLAIRSDGTDDGNPYDGTVWAWGNNVRGQLGDGTTTNRPTPVQVKGDDGVGYLADIASVAAGNYHSLALRNDHLVRAWGFNDSGQLGDNTTTDRHTPVPVKDYSGTTGLQGVTSIAAGANHSLARLGDGHVMAWGANSYGQCGMDPRWVNHTPYPVHVYDAAGNITGELGGVAYVAAGEQHSLALMNDTHVVAWGWNNYGQLGDNTTTTRYAPRDVYSGSGLYSGGAITKVDAGTYHSLALRSDGTVWDWGSNFSGQLGNDSTTDSHTAVKVTGLADVVDASAGGDHSLAVKSDGTVWSWGDNYHGQLGDGTHTNHQRPVQVGKRIVEIEYLSGAAKVAAGDNHSLALMQDGSVYAWGTSSDTAAKVSGLTDVLDVAAGGGYSLAIKSDGTDDGNPYDGTVWAWTPGHTPGQVRGPYGNGYLTDVVDVAAGEGHSLALMEDNAGKTTVWAWGDNYDGQLGEGTKTNRTYPVQVHGPGNVSYLTDVKAIACGAWHSLALKNDGTIWAWGDGLNGQLGVHTNGDHTVPYQVHGPGDVSYLTDVEDIAGGYRHSLAVKSDGTVYAWGEGGHGQLGLNSDNDHTVPYQVHGLNNSQPPDNGLSGIGHVSGGEYHSIALGNDGTVYAWGENSSGQLGTNSTNDHYYPVQVQGPGGVAVSGYLSEVRAVDAGASFNLAVKNDGTVWGWGDNGSGQLGTNSTNDHHTPAQVISKVTTYIVIGGPPEGAMKPHITQVVPASGATGVSRRTDVVATFSEQMDKGTLTKENFELYELSDTKGPIRITYVSVKPNPEGTEVTLDPYGTSGKALAKDTAYKAVITRGVKDLAGNPIAESETWRFETGRQMGQ
jgi:alpha-tubulin suppressor-like RCC1 family protein